jgi:hypothetical protein
MWIESHQALARHPKTLRLARLLEIGLPAAVGHLHFFWWWCVDYADDGDLSRFESAEIGLAACWPGDAQAFVASLVAAGFVDEDDGVLSVHDWSQYGGKIALRRRANAERMRIARTTKVRDTSDPRAADVQGERREENRREDNTREDARLAPLGAGAQPANVTPITRGKRATTAPATFDLADSHYDLAESLGFTTQETLDETARFLDWHRAKGTTFTDWSSAWRNWMRKARELRGERRPAPRSADDYAAAFDRLVDAAALAKELPR